jgi:hypothetical protein
MCRIPKSLISLALIVAGCALPNARNDETNMALMRERQAAAIAQARTAQLEVEVALIRAKLAERDRLDLELRRQQIQMAERLDHVLELQQRTYQAVTENPTGNSIVEYKELPAPSSRQPEMRAIVRTVERLSLNPEQKQAIIQMFHPPRQLDGNNPWGNAAESR